MSGGTMTGLLDGLDAPPARAQRPSRTFVPARLKDWYRGVRQDPEKRRRWKRVAQVALALGVLGGGIGAYFALRERPTPEYLTGPMDDVLDYTLFSDEFNNLPVKERLRLMADLVQRLKGLSAGDSELMAAFAAGIEGDLRRKLEENLSRLAIDAWDEKAKEYEKVKPEDRKKYLEDAYIAFEKMMEGLGGRSRDISDEDRLARAKRNAMRDYEGFKSGKNRPDNESMGKFIGFMNTRMASNATPSQRARGSEMMRDMARTFRGQDPATGK